MDKPLIYIIAVAYVIATLLPAISYLIEWIVDKLNKRKECEG